MKKFYGRLMGIALLGIIGHALTPVLYAVMLDIRQSKDSELFELEISGQPGSLFSIQSSVNLTDWNEIDTIKLEEGKSVILIDQDEIVNFRFFRAISLPILKSDSIVVDSMFALADASGRYYVSVFENGNFSTLRELGKLEGNSCGVAVGDFDRDGFDDLVIGSSALGDLLQPYFLKGLKNNTFSNPVALQTTSNAGGWMMAAAVGDFDVDGRLDVVINLNSEAVAAYWGNGDGTFIQETFLFQGNGRALDSGDFNEDGYIDLVRTIFNEDGGEVNILLSNGNREFIQSEFVIAVTEEESFGLAAGDFDEDGHLDVLLSKGSNGNITLYLGDGNGQFQDALIVPELKISNYTALDSIDFNGDGHLDVILTSNTSRTNYFWPGLGNGKFGEKQVLSGQPHADALGIKARPLEDAFDLEIFPIDPIVKIGEKFNLEARGSEFILEGDISWEFADGTTVYGEKASYSYQQEGQFATRLLYNYNEDSIIRRGTVVFVKGNSPTADSGGPYTFNENCAFKTNWTAKLSASGSSDDFGIALYGWEFGDGTSSLDSGSEATHIWSGAGPWNVILTVIDAAGQTNSSETTVSFLKGKPPVAVVEGQLFADESFANNGIWSIPFSGEKSSDDYGIWKYEWDFGNGKILQGENAIAEFDKPGEYHVKLTVTDHAGQTHSATHDISLRSNLPPQSVISGPNVIDESFAFEGVWTGSWSAINSSDDFGIQNFEWNFSDGSDLVVSKNPNVTHKFSEPGNYTISLTVYDNANLSTTENYEVHVVGNDIPLPKIYASATKTEGFLPITLSASDSNDDFGIWKFRWTLPESTFPFNEFNSFEDDWIIHRGQLSDALYIEGNGNWDESSAVYNPGGFPRGSILEGSILTPSEGGAYAMVGFRDINNPLLGSYDQLEHGIYFSNGQIQVYERGLLQETFGRYSKGDLLEFRIETKPSQGAKYYIRSKNEAGPFSLLYESVNGNAPIFTIGMYVLSGNFGFQNFKIRPIFFNEAITTPIPMGGEVTLDVFDHAGQTGTTSINISSFIGSPPNAIIVQDTSGLNDNRFVSFDGSLSTDDQGISSYLWDFGDGSEHKDGKFQTHQYEKAGRYNVVLTVQDYAGQSDSAVVLIDVKGQQKISTIPWRIIGDIELPHETWSGKEITLKAVAEEVDLPFQYVWDFGDGSAPFEGLIKTPMERLAIEAKHTYFALEGTRFNATLEVIDPHGNVFSDIYPIRVREKAIDVEMNVAIDEGLWFLHKTQALPVRLNENEMGTFWSFNQYRMGITASAVQAFAINGHLEYMDSGRDPYVRDVIRGVNFLTEQLQPKGINRQAGGNPDLNGNNMGLEFAAGITDRPVYELGQVMDAIVALGTPDAITRYAKNSLVKQKSYRELVQDMADMYSWGQTDESLGGWRYVWNSEIDNSASQWAAIGYMAGEQHYGTLTPDWVKERTLNWVRYSRGPYGYGYQAQDDAPSGATFATTASAMVQMAWLGIDKNNALWRHGENYLARNWIHSNFIKDKHFYLFYALTKALRLAVPSPVVKFEINGFDWYWDSQNGLVRHLLDWQDLKTGSWVGKNDDHNLPNPSYATAWAIIMLSGSLFQQSPEAIINASPNPAAVGQEIILDGRESFHQDPSFSIVEYRWDFDDSDGVDFANPDEIGPVVSKAFSALKKYQVSLQVVDNNTPPVTDIAQIEIQITVPPHPPTADAGGPYIASVGETIIFDGSESFDIDEPLGDKIQAWNWEIDFIQPLDFDDYVFGEKAVVQNGSMTPGIRQIGLKVFDSTSSVFSGTGFPDLSDEAYSSVTIYRLLVDDLSGRPKGLKNQLVWTKVGSEAAILRSEEGPNVGFVEIARTRSDFATFLDQDIDVLKGYYYRILIYEDNNPDPVGSSNSQFIYVPERGDPNGRPVFVSTPTLVSSVGREYFYIAEAIDREKEIIVYSLIDGPSGMIIDHYTGLVLFKPQSEQVGQHNVALRAVDSVGNYGVQTFTLKVLPEFENEAPNITSFPKIGALVGEKWEYAATAIDPEGESISWSMVLCPAGMRLKEDGTLEWVPEDLHQGEVSVVIRVDDPLGGFDLQSFTLNVRSKNFAPFIVSDPPITGTVGSTYLYSVQAKDPENDELDYTFAETAIIGMTINPQTGIINWQPRQDQIGNHRFVVQVADIFGAYDQQECIVHVGDPNANRLPIITSKPLTLATPDILYNYQIIAIDPEESTLEYVLQTGPSGMVVESSGLLTWTPQEIDLGYHSVRLAVFDEDQAGVTQEFEIHVKENLPPVILSEPNRTGEVGNQYSYQVQAKDPEGGLLEYYLFGIENSPIFIDSEGLVQWVPGILDVGNNVVTVRVVDDFNVWTEQTYNITVAPDRNPPLVELRFMEGSNLHFDPEAAIREGSDIRVSVVAVDQNGIQEVSLQINGKSEPLDDFHGVDLPNVSSGRYNFLASAVDTSGNVGMAEEEIFVGSVFDVSNPVVEILSPEDNSEITNVISILGNVYDPNGFLRDFSVSYALASNVYLQDLSGDFKEIVRRAEEVRGGELAKFDPTMLSNDSYIIKVTARNYMGGITSKAVQLNVTGSLKLGNFRLEFTDLNIPLAGIPIQIKRVYDTLQANQEGDFGYGWTLALQDADIRETIPDLGGYTIFEVAPFKEDMRVYLTAPDGNRIGFTFTTEPETEWPYYLFPEMVNPIFEADPGIYDRLEVPETGNILYRQPDGTVVYPVFSFIPYNPSTYILTTKDGIKYHYDQSKGLQKVVDLNGNEVTFSSTGIFHSSGSSISFNRDSRGRITEIIDPEGNPITYSYSMEGDLEAYIDRGEFLTQYNYSPLHAHYLEEIIDPLGRSAVKTEYDDNGRIVSITDANGNKVEQNFPPGSFEGTIRDARGNITKVWYNDRGNIIQQEDPLGGIKKWEFDDPKNPDLETAVIDENGNRTEYTYDAAGNKLTETNALGQVTKWTYNSLGKITSIENHAEQKVVYEYDGRGNRTSVTNHKGHTIRWDYDQSGRQTAVVDYAGNRTEYKYSGGNGGCCGSLPNEIVYPDGGIHSFRTNANNLITEEVDPTGAEIKYVLDDYGRPVTIIDAGGGQTDLYFDGNTVHLSKMISPMGATTLFEFDSKGNLLKRIDPNGGVSEFIYDNNENQISIVDPIGNLTTFEYDALDRKSKESVVIGGQNFDFIYSYDGVGNLVEIEQPNGKKILYEYDNLNRIRKEHWATAGGSIVRTVSYEYDEMGRLIEAFDPDSHYNFHYNDFNELIKVDNSGTPNAPEVILSYTYDINGNVVSTVDNFGVTVDRELDTMGRPVVLKWFGGRVNPARVEFLYNKRGDRTAIKRYSDLEGFELVSASDYAYHPLGMIEEIHHKDRDGNSLAEYKYSFFQDGLVSRADHHGVVRDYSYDQAGRLFEVFKSIGENEVYRYDSIGNREESYPPDLYYQNGPANQIKSDGMYEYEYDENGNRVKMIDLETGQESRYTYDHRNRLVRVEGGYGGNDPGSIVEFRYDLFNRRIAKISDMDYTFTIFDNDNAWADFDIHGNDINRYLFNRSIPKNPKQPGVWSEMVAEIAYAEKEVELDDHRNQGMDDILCQSVDSGAALWMLKDNQGSVIDIHNNLGTIIQTIEYTAYGRIPDNSPLADNTRYLYTGREWEAEIGLYYYRARYYDPNLGNFISPDPVGISESDLNSYRYVFNNPLSYVDPTGRTIMASEKMMLSNVLLALGGLVIDAIDVICEDINHPEKNVEMIKFIVIQGSTWSGLVFLKYYSLFGGGASVIGVWDAFYNCYLDNPTGDLSKTNKRRKRRK